MTYEKNGPSSASDSFQEWCQETYFACWAVKDDNFPVQGKSGLNSLSHVGSQVNLAMTSTHCTWMMSIFRWRQWIKCLPFSSCIQASAFRFSSKNFDSCSVKSSCHLSGLVYSLHCVPSEYEWQRCCIKKFLPWGPGPKDTFGDNWREMKRCYFMCGIKQDANLFNCIPRTSGLAGSGSWWFD